MRTGLPLDHFDPDSEVVDAVRDEKIAAPINPELARAWRNLDTGALVVAVATEDNERGGEVLVFHRIPGAEFRDISYSIAAQHLRDVNVNGKPDLDSAYKTLTTSLSTSTAFFPQLRTTKPGKRIRRGS